MPKERSTEVVPGMAEAVENRRRELGIRAGQLAERAGITMPGLEPVRKGYRRAYTDKVRFGVARALRWEPDAIDRLLRGEEPIPAKDMNATVEAIYADALLSASGKATLVAVYRELAALEGV